MRKLLVSIHFVCFMAVAASLSGQSVTQTPLHESIVSINPSKWQCKVSAEGLLIVVPPHSFEGNKKADICVDPSRFDIKGNKRIVKIRSLANPRYRSSKMVDFYTEQWNIMR
jgi:hypothetical protein